ncbi:MAG: very short patch repair endonuclease [Rhodanobacter lindaniclasticus]
MDVVDRATRSRMMSGIRGKNTKPELAVRSFLHRAGLRFRLHAKLPGKPDLVLPKYRTVVFVHGCFWHRHEDCRYATTPTSNPEFWREKFAANVRRDARVRQQLEELGWRVLVIWSCQLDEPSLKRLAREIRKRK